MPIRRPPPLLQLAAMDADDLAILSAHLQDMQIAIGDLAYLPAERRFALVGKRFDWVKAAVGGCERCGHRPALRSGALRRPRRLRAG